MRLRHFTLLLAFFGLVTSQPCDAGTIQCAIFARAETGVDLYGDAWRWWEQAAQAYARGAAPRPGALLVFKRVNGMPHGHVAVVTAVVGPREIRVDHANWSHGRISRSIAVVDASAQNDWSVVRVKTDGVASFGRENPSYGFIYPARGIHHDGRRGFADAVLQMGDASVAERLTLSLEEARADGDGPVGDTAELQPESETAAEIQVQPVQVSLGSRLHGSDTATVFER